MYDQVGKKIKNVVSIIVGFLCVASIIIGLLIGAISAVFNRDGGTAVFLGVVVAVIGCFLAWLLGLLVYALGEMTDSLMSIQKILSKMSKSGTQEICTDSKKEECVNATSSVVHMEPKFTEDGKWICFSCKTTNQPNHSYCAKCNVSRKWSDEKYRKGCEI